MAQVIQPVALDNGYGMVQVSITMVFHAILYNYN